MESLYRDPYIVVHRSSPWTWIFSLAYMVRIKPLKNPEQPTARGATFDLIGPCKFFLCIFFSSLTSMTIWYRDFFLKLPQKMAHSISGFVLRTNSHLKECGKIPPPTLFLQVNLKMGKTLDCNSHHILQGFNFLTFVLNKWLLPTLAIPDSDLETFKDMSVTFPYLHTPHWPPLQARWTYKHQYWLDPDLVMIVYSERFTPRQNLNPSLLENHEWTKLWLIDKVDETNYRWEDTGTMIFGVRGALLFPFP